MSGRRPIQQTRRPPLDVFEPFLSRFWAVFGWFHGGEKRVGCRRRRAARRRRRRRRRQRRRASRRCGRRRLAPLPRSPLPPSCLRRFGCIASQEDAERSSAASMWRLCVVQAPAKKPAKKAPAKKSPAAKKKSPKVRPTQRIIQQYVRTQVSCALVRRPRARPRSLCRWVWSARARRSAEARRTMPAWPRKAPR